jgi:ribosomal protein S12 methylthiotransferase
LMYFYPMYIDDQLIETIASAERILPYIDIPLQHINDTMLRRMSRRVTREQTERLLEKLRSGIDNLSLRTTFITGFPGETDEQFDELAEFVAEQQFERLGVFTYSFEPDTPAAQLPDQVSETVMEERRDRLMQVQQQVAFAQNEAKIGSCMDVILDLALPDEDNVWIGRTFADAPDVDSVIYVTGSDEVPLSTGKIVASEIVATQDYDLVAVAVGEPR